MSAAAVKLLNSIQLFATQLTVACQAPLSMGFSRQEYWSGLPFLLQGIFPTQGFYMHLLYWQEDSLPLNHLGSPQSILKCGKCHHNYI